MRIFRRVSPYLKPHKWRLFGGLLALVVGTPLGLVQPLIWKYIVDDVVLVGGPVTWLVAAIAFMLAVELVAVVLNGVRINLLETAGQRFVVDLRAEVYRKLQEQSVAYHHDHRVGDLLARGVNDIETLQNALLRGLSQVVGSLVGFVLVAAAVVWLNPVVGGLTLLPMAAVFFIVRRFNGHVKAVYRAARDRLGDVSARFQENLAGVVVIKSFSRERFAMGLFQEENRRYLDASERGIRARSRFLPTVHYVGFLGSAVMLGVGGYFAVAGMMTVGTLVAYRGYWFRLFAPIDTLANVNDLLQRARAAAGRVFELLDEAEAVRDAPGAVDLGSVEGEIRFENVGFAYGAPTGPGLESETGEPVPDEPDGASGPAGEARAGHFVLEEVSLTVRPGQTIALVGPSGAGKSTLLSLVPRFFDAVEGRVLVDGYDVRAVTQRSLRRHIAMVQQDTFLFNGTVEENIRWGRPEATYAEVWEAARMANAHSFIEALPDGYETIVGERGVKLSGGQRQRIAIARAFLADPKILILDEATSSVEPESEWIIQHTLERLMKGRTTLLTSHRLSMVRNADLIVAIDERRVVEQGTHEELLRRRGLYYHMYALQVGHLQGRRAPADTLAVTGDPDRHFPRKRAGGERAEGPRVEEESAAAWKNGSRRDHRLSPRSGTATRASSGLTPTDPAG